MAVTRVAEDAPEVAQSQREVTPTAALVAPLMEPGNSVILPH